MSINPDIELVKHILDETKFILDHTRNISLEEYLNDSVLCRASIRSLEIIGEATKKLSESFKMQHSDIEWKKIAGTRDKLIHDYYGKTLTTNPIRRCKLTHLRRNYSHPKIPNVTIV